MNRRLAPSLALLASLFAVALLLAASAQAATPAPRWEVSTRAIPTNFTAPETAGDDAYAIYVKNVGNAPSSGEVTITDTLPAHVTALSIQLEGGSERGAALCTTAPVRCRYPGSSGLPAIQPGLRLEMIVHLRVGSTASGLLTNSVAVTGGGAPDAIAVSTNQVSPSPAPFGIQDFAMPVLGEDGTPFTQAGGHPYELSTTIDFNTEFAPNGEPGTGQGTGQWRPSQQPDNVFADLPPGLIGNPRAVPPCSLAQFHAGECPLDSQVGTGILLITFFRSFGGPFYDTVGAQMFNLKAQPGVAGELGLHTTGGPSYILLASVLPDGEYALRVASEGNPVVFLLSASLTTWGVPADPVHDPERGRFCSSRLQCTERTGGQPSDAQPPRPFLTMPTECTGEPLTATAEADSWDNRGAYVTATTTIPALGGCNQLQFGPKIKARPTTTAADSPSGLDFELEVPQDEEPRSTATAELREATVTLPQGLTVNPSSAAGLGACSEAQLNLKGAGAAQCPDASKLGSVAVESPLVDHPLPGAVYLAEPFENPFHSLIALYIAIDDPQTGVVIKLAGKVGMDPQTGRLTTSFEESPQLPFERLKLSLFNGALGALRTPPTCGTYTTTSALTPYSAPESGPPAEPKDEFETTKSAQGGACPASQPNAPVFHAGTENTQAGAFSPFSLKLVREDGSQELAKIDTTLPPGLIGKLAGISECSDAQLAAAAASGHTGKAEQAAPSCPLNSEVGSVDVAAGAGPTPYYTSGKAYLAGPYKGAPLSLAIITPAVAGPFDLGTVVVRSALYVDPFTAQIHAVSDEIPHILQGIPLDVRSVTLKMNRPNFTLNPTNCNELGFSGAATSLLGQSAPLAQRFQVGGCSALPFKPKLKLSLKGGTKRNQNPALTATLTMPPGGANIASAQVTLPHSAFLDQAHIGTVCTRVQFAAHACPAASVYGKAIAYSPLLDQPLSGPVYLRSSSNKLPDLVADLNGQIEVTLDGKVDTGKGGGIRNTFTAVPDAPVSKFVLSMQGGKKGLLVNSENICSKPQKALAHFVGQNGKVDNFSPTIANSCGKKGKKKGKGKQHHKASRVGTSHR